MSISVPTLKPGKNHGKGSLKAIQVLLNINVHLCPPLSARTSPHDYLRDGGTRAFIFSLACSHNLSLRKYLLHFALSLGRRVGTDGSRISVSQ